ncbi:MAG TPA: aspartate aminotransferase family protein [Alphaproteobacteria bacterium]|nr:aspartate aminotransferase family protein [Alphaproteobacteria bacterium]
MTELPKKGIAWDRLETMLDEARTEDVDWRNGRIGVYIHYAGEDVLEVAKKAYLKYFSENGLGPKAFPSLARFESEVIGMSLALFNAGPDAAGAMTTGGTESIFLAVKAARDHARRHRPEIAQPEIVAAQTAHPAFNKAAHFLGLRVRRVPVDAAFLADPKALEAAIGRDTIMLVGSAPAFPHGVVDPIPALGEIAERRGLWLHVDACVGGYIAPFARKLGIEMPAFDFTVPGVRSISADLHKYGYTAKGASAVLYRDRESFSYQAYEFDDWPRGKYFTQSLVGTRAGGAIAAAWAVMNYLGEDGYLRITERVLAVRRAIEDGVRKLGFEVWGKPQLGIVAYGMRDGDIFAVADRLAARGWFVGRLNEPRGIHLMLNLTHEPVVERYLADLAAARDEAARTPRMANATVTY